MITACGTIAPAQTPPQLVHTPEAFVVVTDKTFDAGVFQIAYPGGWRVVKSSMAGAPIQVVFVSPDEVITITVSEVDESQSDGSFVNYHEFEDGTIIQIEGQAPLSQETQLREIFDQMSASLQGNTRR